MFSDNIGIKLEINDRKTFGKSPNNWELNNTFLNLRLKGNIKREIRSDSEPDEDENSIQKKLMAQKQDFNGNL